MKTIRQTITALMQLNPRRDQQDQEIRAERTSSRDRTNAVAAGRKLFAVWPLLVIFGLVIASGFYAGLAAAPGETQTLMKEEPTMAATGSELKVGDTAPAFCIVDMHQKPACLSDYKGKWVVLYFYPKDETPGCTMEAIYFTKYHQDFTQMNAEILGISPDSPESHCQFADNHKLDLTLLSDPEQVALDKYGVWQLKRLLGKEYFGVVRSTFLIDPQGEIKYIWRNVKIDGHAEAVKDKLAELQL